MLSPVLKGCVYNFGGWTTQFHIAFQFLKHHKEDHKLVSAFRIWIRMVLKYWPLLLSLSSLECQNAIRISSKLSSINLELMSVTELPVSLTLMLNTCQEFVPLKCTFFHRTGIEINTWQSLLIPLIALFSCYSVAFCDLNQ